MKPSTRGGGISGISARDAGSLEMDPYRVVEVAAITASDRDGYRNSHLPTELENKCVASRESVERQTKAAQQVSLVRIGAGEIKDEVRLRLGEDCRKMVGE